MKKYFLSAFVAFSINVNAQITFEYDYDSAATTNAPSSKTSQLMIIKFEVSSERYVKVNRAGYNISIYDMNHALVKNISLAGAPLNPGNTVGDVLYLSEGLFNTDSKIEFMYVAGALVPPYTGIYNEDGTVLFSDTCVPAIKINFPSQQYPIYNTSVGSKMILSYFNGHAKVFSLPGTLSTGIQEGNAALVQAQGSLGNLYPNPSTGKITLQYELPKGEHAGEIILYNQQGAEVKRYKVDNTFNDLLLDNTMLPAGVYYWQLTTAKGATAKSSARMAEELSSSEEIITNMNVYPNPASSDVTIDFRMNESKDVNVTVMDMMGRIVIDKKHSAQEGSNTLGLDVSNLEQGVYLIAIGDNGESVKKRLIVTR